jgi:hypothetical protein
VFLDGVHCGYEHYRWRTAQHDGQTVRHVEWQIVLRVLRQGQFNQTEIAAAGLELPDGQPLEFRCRNAIGNVELVAHVHEGILHLRSSSGGASPRDTQLPLLAGDRGFLAVEQSLVAQQPVPGERRRLRVFNLIFGQFIEVQLHALRYESVDCLGESRRLLALDASMSLRSGPPLQSRLWVDAQGVVWKTQALGVPIPQAAFRTSRQRAIPSDAQALPDVGRAAMVPVAQRLPDVHRRTAARYRVALRDGDPARWFKSDQRQHIRPLDEHTVEVVVRRVEPPTQQEKAGMAATGPGSASATGPEGASGTALPDASGTGLHSTSVAGPSVPGIYLAPSELLQSDDPLIVSLARDAAQGHRDPYQAALALESWVHRAMRRVDYGTTFASAAQVARGREGDCTEHAVLLTALCRARGIPARLAVGLVYVPSAQAFAFHMWSEVFVRGTWVPLDATLGLGGIGAGHLKLADTALEDRRALATLLGVVELMGRLEIQWCDER